MRELAVSTNDYEKYIRGRSTKEAIELAGNDMVDRINKSFLFRGEFDPSITQPNNKELCLKLFQLPADAIRVLESMEGEIFDRRYFMKRPGKDQEKKLKEKSLNKS